MIYIKISDGDRYFIDTVEGAKSTLDHMVESSSVWSDEQEFIFSTIEMTEEEFNDLPEFQGF